MASVRLPVTLTRSRDRWNVAPSVGGLATALRAVAEQRPFTWLGWPGSTIAPRDHAEVRTELGSIGCVPLFLGRRELTGFYDQFSNRVLWPLLHNLPDRVNYDRSSWAHYQAVNRRFADAIAELAKPGDSIWIHDYQLALVPQLLRERGLECAIGFFLHIPFPAAETYRKLPVREQVLRGLLGSNLIGFHTYEYVTHFRSACLRVLGLDSDPEAVFMPTHTARLSALPIGIEPREIEAMAETAEARDELAGLARRFEHKRVIVGVDRLDYTKGLPQKLLGYEELLNDYPRWRGKVVLVQVAAPSRMDVPEYQSLKREVDELVGRINGRHGSMESTPIVYVNQSVSRERLTALYQVADVALITPLRDGMNLVCLEYIAARAEHPGTLVLSEFAGAATCLSGARLINPHNPSQIAEVLDDALARSTPDQRTFEHMLDFVYANTSTQWAQRFLSRLDSVYEELHAGVRRFDLDAVDPAVLRREGTPLLLLDYDGTMQPHAPTPEAAAPSPRVIRLLERLGRLATVYVVSGRSAAVLDNWLGNLPIGFACEHGLAIKAPGGDWETPPPIDRSVLDDIVLPVLRDFVERTPGSQIEEKSASIAWHYRSADPRLGAWRAKDLYALLEERLRGQEFSVLVGSRVLEVRHRAVSKGAVSTTLLERHPNARQVIAAGNDRTDEEMFEALLRSDIEQLLLCRVGGRNTVAQYFLETPAELLTQLERLADRWRAEEASPTDERGRHSDKDASPSCSG